MPVSKGNSIEHREPLPVLRAIENGSGVSEVSTAAGSKMQRI